MIPASSRACQLTSSIMRCCGSSSCASTGEIRKNESSNLSMSSTKAPKRQLSFSMRRSPNSCPQRPASENRAPFRSRRCRRFQAAARRPRYRLHREIGRPFPRSQLVRKVISTCSVRLDYDLKARICQRLFTGGALSKGSPDYGITDGTEQCGSAT